MRRLSSMVALALCASGCRVPPRGGLDEVVRLLDARGAPQLRWNQVLKEDDEAGRAVDRLLGEELTPASAVEIALVGSAAVQATLERLGIAQADAVQAGLLKNPTFGVHPGLPIGSPSWSGVAWEVSLALDVLDLLVLPLRKKLARIEFERARLLVAADIWSVVTEVRSAYYEALAAAQRLELQRTIADTAELGADFSRRQEIAGTLSELSLVTEQGMYVQARVDLVRAEREAISARERLVRAMGLWSGHDRIKLPIRLPLPPEHESDLDRLESRAMEQRLDLLAAEHDAEAFERTVKLAKGTRFLAGIAVGGDAHREADRGYKVIGPSVAIELPIFDQGQARIAKLVSETRRARRQADALALEIRSRVREQASSLLAARSLADYLGHVVVPLRERTVGLAQQQYDAMLIGLPQLLWAKQGEMSAWRDYVDSVRDYWVTRAELERAVGGPLEASAESTHGENTMMKRRELLAGTAIAVTSMLGKKARGAVSAPSLPRGPYVPVETPNGATLPFRVVNDVKEFHLVAEPVRRELAPGLVINAWGYNGQTPGPTLEAVEGDHVRILVTNKLPEATSVHWHGVILPNGMDGVAGLNQPAIRPGETYAYEFTLKQHGTQLYHPHSDEMVQMAMGMMGFFVIHPRATPSPRIDRDFCIFLHEWFVEPGTMTPNANVMTDFNLFTFNSRVYPATAPLVIRTNERVRIRFANLSMDNHPIHLHGHRFAMTGTDGGPTPHSAQHPATTVDVPPGTTRDIEFVADNPGDWVLHCHKSHHTMNQMAHDIPNTTGVSQKGLEQRVKKLLPGYMAMGESGMGDMASMHMGAPRNTLPMMSGRGVYGPVGMGGMFTVVKIRDGITSYDDPVPYVPPTGTLAKKVSG